MGKIAALILPENRRAELDRLCDKMGDLLLQSPLQKIEKNTYLGDDAVCGLLRVRPDALNSAPQPIRSGASAGVACGYYLDNEEPHGNAPGAASMMQKTDSATRLIQDIATSGGRQLPHHDGVYAFACWDDHEARLIAGVDKLGMQPLFWTEIKGGGYAVASEAKALVPFIDEPFVNWSAWEEYLTFGFLFGNHTQFKGIDRLGAAEVIECSAHRHSIKRTENFLENIDIVDRSTADFLEEQHAVFDRALSRLTDLFDQEHEAILTLSGGFDSRRIFGWLLQNKVGFDAYTVPDIQPDGTEHESRIVSALCQQYGITGYRVYPDSVAGRQRVFDIRDLATDFESDEHRYATILAMALDCHNKVNFDGLGGDVLVSAVLLNKSYFQADGQKRFIESWPLHRLDKWLRLPSGGPPLKTRLRNELQQWGDDPNRFTYFYLMSRFRREVALAPLMIQANVMTTLCPYLDRQCMVSALSFPPWKRLDAELQRALIRQYDPALLEIPTTHDRGIGSDPKYARMTEGIERKAQIRNLQAMSRRLSKAKAWRPESVQKWRFRATSHFHGVLPQGLVQWELGKAERTASLMHFMDAAACRNRYVKEARTLKNVFGSQRNWVQYINK